MSPTKNPKIIGQLTAEQEAYLPEFRERWLQRGLATGPCDRAEIERACRLVYEAANKPWPPLVVWMSSPLGGAFVSAALSQTFPDQLVDQFRSQFEWPLGGQLRGHLGDQLGGELRSQLWTQLGDQLWDQLRGQLGGQPGDHLRGQLRNQLWDQLRGQLGNQLRDQLGGRGQLGNQLGNQLGKQLRAQLGGQLKSQLEGQLAGELRGQLWDQLGNHLRGELRDRPMGLLAGELWYEVGGQIKDQLRGEFVSQIVDQLWNQLGDQLLNQLESQLREQVTFACWGQHDISWIAWLQFGRAIGAKFSLPTWLDGMDGMSDAGWWWPREGVVILTERPNELHRDAQGRLHSEKSIAIGYDDGWGVYAIHGVRVTEQIVLRPHELTPQSIMAEANAEVRRVAIERFGWDRFVSEAGLVLLDEVPDPANAPHTLALYAVPDNLLGFDARVLLCTNASPERDGTVRRFGLTCPVDMPDALTAAAWTFNLSRKEYATLERAS